MTSNNHSESLLAGHLPKGVNEAADFVLKFIPKDDIKATAEDPSNNMGVWNRVSNELGCLDSNRPLLMDCLSRNDFNNKPEGVEFSAWVSLMTAAEKMFGIETVCKFKFRE